MCNGGLSNNSGNGNGHNSVVGNFSQPVSKGLNFREVLAYLVLITRGTREEKIKCKTYTLSFLVEKLSIFHRFARQNVHCKGVQGSIFSSNFKKDLNCSLKFELHVSKQIFKKTLHPHF